MKLQNLTNLLESKQNLVKYTLSEINILLLNINYHYLYLQDFQPGWACQEQTL
jgi:hypothetical protein